MNAERIILQSSYDLDRVEELIHPVKAKQVNVWPASRWIRMFWCRGISGVTQWRWILVDPRLLSGATDRLARLVIHELVHLRQFREQRYVPFMLRYLRDYLRGRVSGMSGREAYLAIPAEVEAREITSRVT